MTPTLATILTKQYDRYHALAFADGTTEYGPADEAWMRFLVRVHETYGLLMREIFEIAA